MSSGPDQTAPAQPPTPPLRVLYADDVDHLRNLMTMVLQREGHKVETVEDGEKAWQKISGQADAYDLIITDHHMPRMNGMELVRRIRSTGFGGKIIVFSSEIKVDVSSQYRAFSVDLILQKPVVPAEFRQKLRELYAAAARPAGA